MYLKKQVLCSVIFYIFLIKIVQGEALKSKLISIEDCKQPPGQEKTSPVTHYIQAKKINRSTVLMFGNITIPKRMGPVTHNIRVYRVQRSTVRELEFHLDKLSCHNLFIEQIMTFIKIKYDKDCYAYANTYSFDNLNIEELTGLLARTAVGPGQYAYDLEFELDKDTAICVTLLVDMAAVKAPK